MPEISAVIELGSRPGELALVFLAGGPFEATHLERDPVRLGPAPALFVRIRLIRPSAA